ncbi:hypothetical protein [Cytobacillus purgationiresistens]|uniref:Aminoglycoside phosphotransferase domain-containing protein n=1 Tax=Cytobacillus purgationiresistens TaxID=863449 RepID=A0ABU0AJI1_9BACI|nr:hypothetical protein [Cytobacillus purgationiresistens]MDQ0271421.1 hypothetical protein [Cytobacillus purgationiresistens]
MRLLEFKMEGKTNNGDFLIKQYNQERMKLYNADSLLLVFEQQARLQRNGFPCPRLYSHDDNFLFESENAERFLIMEYCDGDIIPPGKINKAQMLDLGKATGPHAWSFE